MTRAALVLATLLALLLLAPAALAARPANPDERAKWAESLTIPGQYEPPAECVDGSVSTVDEWWGIAFASHADTCPDTGDGFYLMHWRPDDQFWVIEYE